MELRNAYISEIPCDFVDFPQLYINMHLFLSSLNCDVCFIRNQKPLCSLTLTFWGSVLLIETSVWFFYFSFHFERNSRKPILYLLWLGILNFSFKGSVVRQNSIHIWKRKREFVGMVTNRTSRSQEMINSSLSSFVDNDYSCHLLRPGIPLTCLKHRPGPGGPPWSITPPKAFCRGYSPKENVRPPCWKLVSQ